MHDYTTFPFPDICALYAMTGISDLFQRLFAEQALTECQRLYLQSWQLSNSDESQDWSNAAERLVKMEVAGCQTYLAHEKRLSTPRKKRPWVKWLLGNLARELRVESDIHYHQALLFLNERRMNDAWLRIRLLCDLGQTHQPVSAAQAHLLYEQALRLCTGENASHIRHSRRSIEDCSGQTSTWGDTRKRCGTASRPPSCTRTSNNARRYGSCLQTSIFRQRTRKKRWKPIARYSR